jgi:hypothetical protein
LNDGPLKTYFNENRNKSPSEKGLALSGNKELNAIHNSFVQNEGLSTHPICLN